MCPSLTHSACSSCLLECHLSESVRSDPVDLKAPEAVARKERVLKLIRPPVGAALVGTVSIYFISVSISSRSFRVEYLLSFKKLPFSGLPSPSLSLSHSIQSFLTCLLECNLCFTSSETGKRTLCPYRNNTLAILHAMLDDGSMYVRELSYAWVSLCINIGLLIYIMSCSFLCLMFSQWTLDCFCMYMQCRPY